ncbi:MAG: calcium-binding protein [Myxococcota bacterium]
MLGALALAGCDPATEDGVAPDGTEEATVQDAGDDAEEASEPNDGSEAGQPDPPPEVDLAGAACDAQAETNDCLPDGMGVQYCDDLWVEGERQLQWGECFDPTEASCELGETRTEEVCVGDLESDCWECQDACSLHDGMPDWDSWQFEEHDCNTPLVLSFDGAPVQMQPAPAATFDINDAGGCVTTDWPAAATPWLALDVDGNGSIESGRELFGSGTRLGDGKRASNGFVALAALDDNGDGSIDAADPKFADLVLWADGDADKRSTWFEIQPLAARGILSIELDYAVDRICDARGNCAVERASFTFIDRGGEVRKGDVVDVHLACQ